MKYFGTEIKLRKSLGVYVTEKAIGEHRLSIDEVQKMNSVADLKEQIILQVFLLGMRVTDAIALKKEDFDRLEQPAPIPIELRATKGTSGTIYETFICQEFKDLLKLYLPTLKGEWLFDGIRQGSHLKDETLNAALKDLANRAKIQLHGKLRWHLGRKLVMTTGAELGLNTWIIKKMVGRTIKVADDTYLYIQLKEGFLRLRSAHARANELLPRCEPASLLFVRCENREYRTYHPVYPDLCLHYPRTVETQQRPTLEFS